MRSPDFDFIPEAIVNPTIIGNVSKALLGKLERRGRTHMSFPERVGVVDELNPKSSSEYCDNTINSLFRRRIEVRSNSIRQKNLGFVDRKIGSFIIMFLPYHHESNRQERITNYY